MPTDFIQRWSGSASSEKSNAQSFINELCDVLGVERPRPATGDAAADGYVFEKPVPFQDGPKQSTGFIDCYKRGCFVLETKQGFDAEHNVGRQGHGKRESIAWDRVMQGAQAQAGRYARNLGSQEPVPPLLIVSDVGYCFDLYADFSGQGRVYVPFPDAGSYRITLDGLRHHDLRERLRLAFFDPHQLDPARHQASVTRELAAKLARLATALESDGHHPNAVFGFLTRCLFSMYAEDAGLLPDQGFSRVLRLYQQNTDVVHHGLEAFWQKMDQGGFAPELKESILRFNGGLFLDTSALPLTRKQYGLLLDAASNDWREVEPAIFGTLLERALDPRERHRLGAHYTPRAYVERLVLPTVIQPLREEWSAAKAAVAQIESTGKQSDAARRKESVGILRKFLHRLSHIRVLDPACGSGNFLYVTLEHLKRLEAEVVKELRRYGESALEMESAAVTPRQLLGVEINPRAAAIADLVLWIGYLQWHLRTHGGPHALQPPILRAYGNIHHKDAVLEHDERIPRTGDDGEPVTRWDGLTMRMHPATGQDVPDESARTAVFDYPDARPAAWPEADFIVGNPPFVGNKRMLEVLGEGYVEALRKTYRGLVPDSSDYVMYWWRKAGDLLREGKIERFGFITTNSITQTFNRRVVEAVLDAGANGSSKQGELAEARRDVHLAFAVPDHPWTDGSSGAAVRIAMTVAAPGTGAGTLVRVMREEDGDEHGREVELLESAGRIHADLTIGADLGSVKPLKANEGISSRGVIHHGAGFLIDQDEIKAFPEVERHRLKIYRNGRDITQTPRDVFVIDTFDLSVNELQHEYPFIYQWLRDRVKPERDQKKDRRIREKWWLHARERGDLRRALARLDRFIVTPQVAKHRFFVFVEGEVLPDDKLIAIALPDTYNLGILSSSVHLTFAIASGGWLGVGNDSVYNKSVCFDAYPFPAATEEQQEKVRRAGKWLDEHRKKVQAEHPDLTLTGIYNVVEKMRAGEVLTTKERDVYERGLVGLLIEIHDTLDAAVAEAYGWPDGLTEEEILVRLVALNKERVAEEEGGLVRYLRPEYQAPETVAIQQTLDIGEAAKGTAGAVATSPEESAIDWPAALPDRMLAVQRVLASAGRPVTAAAVTTRFTGARRDTITQLLETLTALGQARRAEGDTYAA